MGDKAYPTGPEYIATQVKGIRVELPRSFLGNGDLTS